MSYADIVLDAAQVTLALHVSYADWVPVVDLDANRDGALTTEEARRQLGRLGGFARSQVTVVADRQPCTGTATDVEVADRLGTAFASLWMVYRCPAPAHHLAITLTLLEREHPGHRILATIEDRARPAAPPRQHIFGPGSETIELDVGSSASGRLRTVGEFLRLGMAHIFTGYDHVLFLLGLLLVARGFRDLLKIVTSFTVAHTLTLALATLGYVRLDVRLVESVIALSIAYVAVENLVATEHRRRWMLTFVFGLMHGFGFSNVLREMPIPRELLAWSLASFNVGVEVGQVVIVSLLYPVLVWSRGQRWNAWAVRAASVVIGLAGLYWFVERALLAA